MAARNTYLAYKRDTNHLVRWVLRVSNRIIASKQKGNGESDDAGNLDSPNTTGNLTVSALLPLCTLIARNSNASDIPPAVFCLFRSIIKARTAAYESFQQLVDETPDPEVEQSNATHKFFIDTLISAFEVLGGRPSNSEPDEKSENEDDWGELEQLLLNNRFAALVVDDTNPTPDASEDESQQGQASGSSSAQRGPGRQTRPGKGKRSKRGKTQKGKQTEPITQPGLGDIPLEMYRIVQDQDGIMTDYLMAVRALAEEWSTLRAYLQDAWREVAYDGLNSAIAGALSNAAVAMIQRTTSAIFVDFPGHESYETVLNTITRGKPKESQHVFHYNVYTRGPGGNFKHVLESNLDVEEQFLVHAYQDLVDFLADFQCTRSGKPTKRMQKSIRDWDPELDLSKVTKEERLKWRRSYTISWLYDLVNCFSSVVIYHNNAMGEKHVLEDVDWSIKGPWDSYRRVWGLKEFAGFVTSLAWQKQGTKIGHRILPQHVFQLQCIVDSWTASRGWTNNPFAGHVLSSPASEFRPTRDIDLFLGGEGKLFTLGLLHTSLGLRNLLEIHRPGCHALDAHLVQTLQSVLGHWLGDSPYVQGMKFGITPSRFAGTNSNGLWEYSPFLCGVGLVEGLDLTHRVSMQIWDRQPEIFMMIHIHNMLIQKKYIKKPVNFYILLTMIYRGVFFVNGELPASDFGRAFDQVRAAPPRQVQKSILRAKREQRFKRFSEHLVNHSLNVQCKEKCILTILREAEWDVDRIPDSDINCTIPSMMMSLRLLHAAEKDEPTNRSTGNKQLLKETELVKRIRAMGTSDEVILNMCSQFRALLQSILSAIPNRKVPEASLAELREVADLGAYDRRHRQAPKPSKGTKKSNTDNDNLTFVEGTALLELLRFDISSDLAGPQSMSGLNHFSVLFFILFQWRKIEERLAAAAAAAVNKRGLSLGIMILREQVDEECLRIIADELENPEPGGDFLRHHLYFEGLDLSRCGFGGKSEDDDAEKKEEKKPKPESEFGQADLNNMECTVM
ncbi:hypothetical protein QBC44DRAFT_252389 [Cladorrhinum sp. PSN332]|nr:hypothetical protein QBC44DRAFT_252389 [Cladorrhinum sp. PSN332]